MVVNKACSQCKRLILSGEPWSWLDDAYVYLCNDCLFPDLDLEERVAKDLKEFYEEQSGRTVS
jgi:hypothetical protein